MLLEHVCWVAGASASYGANVVATTIAINVSLNFVGYQFCPSGAIPAANSRHLISYNT